MLASSSAKLISAEGSEVDWTDGRSQAGMGVDAGDYNNDGYFDIFVTNFSGDSNTLYQNDESGLQTDVTFPAGLGESSYPYVGWGTGFVDLDNDGLLDIFIANGHVYPEADQAAFARSPRRSAAAC